MVLNRFFLSFAALVCIHFAIAQRICRTYEYTQRLVQANPSLADSFRLSGKLLELGGPARASADDNTKLITIPVVVHILYHYPYEDIPDDVVRSQITALNRDFRLQNADAVGIPAVFKDRAADCLIAFSLATSDPNGAATNGIIRKYTPLTAWTADDRIKLSAQSGDDPWPSTDYLNIWVGSLGSLLGYSSLPGSPSSKDGVVINSSAFGTRTYGIYEKGRTAVHEIGHWLGLKHIWGDKDCGDDGIADTPPQQTFTNGCPSGTRISCGNAPDGDMYMNFMDFTNDDCLLMFTHGQRDEMRSLFAAGGPRYSILQGKGLRPPTIAAAPIPDTPPKFLELKVFPNPATTNLLVDVGYDPRWLGAHLTILNALGEPVDQRTITATEVNIPVSKLKPGLYFIRMERFGERMQKTFVKL